MSVLLVLYLASGLLLAALSVPLILRRIPPNGLYGFRVQQTLGDPAIWYAANEYAGKRLLVAGLGSAAVAIILSFAPGIHLDTYALACGGFILTILGVVLVQSFRYLKAIDE